MLWTGFFPFSREQDTAAFSYEDQIDPELALERVRELNRIQDSITQSLLLETIGETREVLVDSIKDGRATTRSFDSAPEIDGVIFVDGDFKRGDILTVEITDVLGVDRLAVVREADSPSVIEEVESPAVIQDLKSPSVIQSEAKNL